MKHLLVLLVALGLGASLFSKDSAQAYTTCGQPQAMSSFPIPVYLHPGGDFTNVSFADFNRELDRALADWQNLPDSNITFYRSGIINGWYPKLSVSLQTPSDPTYAAQTQCNLGSYTQWMLVNPAYTNFDVDSSDGITPGKLSLAMVLRHEIGHFLGLGHSCDAPGALMCVDWATNPPYGVDRPIDSDARAAMALFYGGGTAPTPTATPTPTPAPTLVSCERVATYSNGDVVKTPITGC